MSLVRSLAGSLVKPLASAIVGSGSGSDLAADVRALFSANGGDFTGTMLDFTKTSRLFSDFEGTEAAAESTLALVVDDQQNGALGAEATGNPDFTSNPSWLAVGSGVPVYNAAEDRIDVTTSGSFQGANQPSAEIPDQAGELWLGRITITLGTLASVRIYWNGSTSIENKVITQSGTYDFYGVSAGGSLYFAVDAGAAGAGTFSINGFSAFKVLGAHAYQSTAGFRPKSTTDAFGTRVAQPDGTDDHMDLPDGVLGDGTQHVHVFAAYALDNANSDSGAALVRGPTSADFGLAVYHNGTTGQPQAFASNSANSAFTDNVYARSLTDNEAVVRVDQFAPTGAKSIKLNGKTVAPEDSPGYTSLDDPGAGTIFGYDTAQNMAGTCHGIVILTGSRAMTAAEIATVEAYLADLASDTLLTADADTVLSRVFRPATDLNVAEGFATADWTDGSFGTSSITVTPGVGVTFNVGGTGEPRADRLFPVRVGYRYRVTASENVGGSVIHRASATAFGSTDYFNANVGADQEFVATSPFVYYRAYSAVDADQLLSLTITEIPATGDYWDMLDETKRFTDAGSTQAGANQQVQQVNSVEGDYPLTQTTSADQATLDGTATNLVFDGSTDFYVATDATDDLVQTGDTTELWAVTPDVSASARVISSAGDSTVATDTASVFSINGSDQLSLQQADASNTETEATAITVTEGAVNVISFVRDGASVVFGIGADEVETETFATVTTPTAGTSPAFNLGISVDQSSGPYDGSIQAGLKLDRALSTGLTIHAIRALEEKTA